MAVGNLRQSIVSCGPVSERPLRKQKEPEEVHPHGHVPLGGFGTASWAPRLGTQNEHEPFSAIVPL
jgi:hypothetical protein